MALALKENSCDLEPDTLAKRNTFGTVSGNPRKKIFHVVYTFTELFRHSFYSIYLLVNPFEGWITVT